MLDLEIPVFCYHSRLASVGMCRMCLVRTATPKLGPDRKPVLKADGTPELAWMPRLQTACTTVASEGMAVDSSSQEVQDARRGVVEMLLTSHPLDCPICDKGGECPLQEQTLTYGPGASRFFYNDKFQNEKHVPLGPLIVLDRERCVQCARCIRYQDEIADDHVLGFNDRGRGMEIITFSDPPFNSKFSGNTTDICPVGALTTTDFRFQARPWEMKYVPSVCPHCAVGCNFTLSVRNNADIKRVLPRENDAVNDIWICDKGRFGHHFADDSANRLTTPLIRRDGELVEATWDEALALVAQKFGEAKSKDPHSIAGLAGDRAPNEDLYLFGKFFREVLGSANYSSTLDADDLNATLGLSADSDITKLGKGNAFFVIGADVEEEAPVAYLRIKQAVNGGATLIVANGRKTKLDRFGTVLPYRYGDDGRLLASLLN
ncbi:MAG: molybdopterin-dependent oxidoreductase, partial [Chloroflexi bacterium]|nr:molybdopterin-dependent oxidoreductase [Chloroflexota bacterium]